MEESMKQKIEDNYKFPKKVGIIFVETGRPSGRTSFRNFIKKLKRSLGSKILIIMHGLTRSRALQ
jgi:hypothetical protein